MCASQYTFMDETYCIPHVLVVMYYLFRIPIICVHNYIFLSYLYVLFIFV